MAEQSMSNSVATENAAGKNFHLQATKPIDNTKVHSSAKVVSTNSNISISSKQRIKSENGQIFTIEYLAPRRNCRVNVLVTAFANGK